VGKKRKDELVQSVIVGAREFTIGTVLFHHAVGNILRVNVTDMECLALIIYRGLATPTDLARYTGLSSGATTAMLDRLETSRLIERTPNPKDGRGTLIALTKIAARRLESLFSPLRQAGAKLASSYSEEELVLVDDFLKRIGIVFREERSKLQQPRRAKAV
jgi:DNA-binding MarR family transcriptional regulator